MTAVTETRADMSAADINDLPDSAFAFIEPGGSKDAGGKTIPRSKRHFPIQDAAHVRNALARLASSPFGDKARPAVVAAAKKFGVEVSDADGDGRAASRPNLELLKRRRGSMIRKAERRGMLLEMRAKPDGTGGTSFEFEGYGAVFDAPFDMWDPWGDPYTEVVRQGAFTRSLSNPQLDVPFLVGHNDAGIPMARTRNGTMQLSQDSHGLLVKATMDGRRSDVRNLASAVERGDMDEMSIGFVTLGQEWSPDWETRAMLDLELHRGDVSAVALGANAATSGSRMAEVTRQDRPAEARASRGEINDNSNTPDFNLATDDPAANGVAAVKCPHTVKNGCGQMLPGGSKFCSNCGGPVYDGDGTLVVDDSGVVTEEGDKADADLLAAHVPNAETLSAWLELELA